MFKNLALIIFAIYNNYYLIYKYMEETVASEPIFKIKKWNAVALWAWGKFRFNIIHVTK